MFPNTGFLDRDIVYAKFHPFERFHAKGQAGIVALQALKLVIVVFKISCNIQGCRPETVVDLSEYPSTEGVVLLGSCAERECNKDNERKQ